VVEFSRDLRFDNIIILMEGDALEIVQAQQKEKCCWNKYGKKE
jgi:hypothetical protein